MSHRPKALVTGAAHRLGRAMSLYLAGRGYDLAVHYHGSQTAAETLCHEVETCGVSALALRADLLDEQAIAGLIPQVIDGLGGPVTVLVNNASIFERDTLDSATSESWTRHMMTNLRAPFLLTQAMADTLPAPLSDADREPLAAGLIVNMIDQRVRKLTPDFMTYTLAKSALWTLTRTAAQALAPRIRVNAIGPGPTLQGARQSAKDFARQRAATPLGRGANSRDITAALGYLMDAPSVTGQLICTDGGQHLNWQTPDLDVPE